MVDAFSPAFTLAPLAPLPLAPAPSGSASAGALVPSTAVGSDWSAKRVDSEAKVRTERRSAIERARHSVEAGWSRPGHLTKAERLAAAASSGRRDTGSLSERRSALSSVQKAMAKVNGTPGAKEISDEDRRGLTANDKESSADHRAVLDALRQRYPGKSLASMVATAQETEKAFLADAVTAREALIARYATMPVENLPTYKVPEYVDGVRGSVQRARQDQADADDLREAAEKYGAENLPQILKQLEAFDRGMINDPHGTSARLATAYGAPAVASQVPAYEAKQAEKRAAAAQEQRLSDMTKGVRALIQQGHLPGDEDTLKEVAAVLKNPRFQHHPTDAAITLKRAAAIVAHPDHVRTTGRRPTARGAGTRSISNSGASPNDRAASGAERYGTGQPNPIRDAIRRAVERA